MNGTDSGALGCPAVEVLTIKHQWKNYFYDFLFCGMLVSLFRLCV